MNRPKLVRQTSPTTCGHCVIAMLDGISESNVVSWLGGSGEVSDMDMLQFAQDCLHQESPRRDVRFRDGKPPRNSVAIQKHRDAKGKREHWTLWFKGQTLDPADKGKKLWPVYKHIVIAG